MKNIVKLATKVV